MLDTELTNLTMAPSPAWQYFDKVDGSKVCCRKCKKTYKFNKSTTSLLNHLRNLHKIEFPQENEQEYEENEIEQPVERADGPLDVFFNSVASFSSM